jgi:hypothetical protein
MIVFSYVYNTAVSFLLIAALDLMISKIMVIDNNRKKN